MATSGTLTTTVKGSCYKGMMYYSSSLIWKDGNEFGFWLFPLKQYKSGDLLVQDDIDAAGGIVTVTVGSLTQLLCTRSSYWSLYG